MVHLMLEPFKDAHLIPSHDTVPVLIETLVKDSLSSPAAMVFFVFFLNLFF